MKKLSVFLIFTLLFVGAVFAGGQKDSAAGKDVIRLKAATTNNITETGGKIFYYFLDYVEKKSEGRVRFDRFPGGTLGGPMEELALLSSGSVDVVPLAHMPHGDSLPLLNFPSWVPGGQEFAVKYFNHLVFENKNTAPLIQAEAEANNIRYLSFLAGGANAFAGKKSFNRLADLRGLKFGAGGNHDAFEGIGLSIVNMFPPEGYDSLSRGIVDATQMAFNPMIQLKWYEVAPYFMFDGTYAAGNPISINLKTWNSLPSDIQELFVEAAEATSAYSIELFVKEMEENIEFLKSKGTKVGTLSQSDIDAWFDALFKSCIATSNSRAVRLGIVEKNRIVIDAAKAFANR